MKFEITHTLPASREKVLEVMLDKAYYQYLQQNHAAVDRIEMLSQDDQGGVVRRRVHYQPKPIIKSIGPKKVPPEAMAWIEESEMNKAAFRATFKNVPVKDWVQKRMTNTGTIELRADGPDRTVRTVAGELKIHFPLLGAIAERIIFSKAREILDGEAALFARYLQAK